MADAVEIARRRAAKLHALAVSCGADPWNPMDIAARAARDRDIDVEPIAPGSPLLNGARAHYDPSDDTIRYEDEGTDFHKSFLIAHELGHACLGDADAPRRLRDRSRAPSRGVTRGRGSGD